MKSILQKIYLAVVLLIIVASNISANKSNWASLNLNNDEIRQIVNFQLTRGGTCLAEFEKIKPILNRFIQEKYNPTNLKNVVGIPNQTVTENQQTELFYYLTSNTKSYKLKVTTNKIQVLHYTVVSCM